MPTCFHPGLRSDAPASGGVAALPPALAQGARAGASAFPSASGLFCFSPGGHTAGRGCSPRPASPPAGKHRLAQTRGDGLGRAQNILRHSRRGILNGSQTAMTRGQSASAEVGCPQCIPKLSVGCVTERGCVVLDQPQQLANLLRLVRRTQPRSDGNGTVNLRMHRVARLFFFLPRPRLACRRPSLPTNERRRVVPYSAKNLWPLWPARHPVPAARQAATRYSGRPGRKPPVWPRWRVLCLPAAGQRIPDAIHAGSGAGSPG